MNAILIISSIAAILTTGAFLPQTIKTIRTKDTSGISKGMYSLFILGVALWFIYGIAIKSLPIVFANGITFFLSSIILILKLKYK